MVSHMKANEKGFIQIWLHDELIETEVNQLLKGISYPEVKKQRVVIDFSSPNIAKEMHVGHLRSTIIGESMCRMLEFMGHEVHRVNHLGDWGTQFGMLIAYMNATENNKEEDTPDIKDLDEYYKAARKKFDSDPAFKKTAQETVVKLQAYDEPTYNAWKKICEISSQEFNKIYKRLGVHIDEFGESYYNKMIPAVIKELEEKGLLVEDSQESKKGVKVEKKEGKKEAKKPEEPEEEKDDFEIEGEQKGKAKCVFVEKYPIPLMIVKSDGGYGYDSTDITAIKYRLHELKGDRLIYITDSGQFPHFDMIFLAARKAGWITDQTVEHMGFGVVLGADGKKFSARKGESVKLMDLLNEAKEKALEQLKSREKEIGKEEGEKEQQVYTSLKPEEYDEAAEKLGIASIKYYDLKQNRISSYAFNYDKMLDPRGNTAVYLLYAYVRMCSIIRKAGNPFIYVGFTTESINELHKTTPYKITHKDERDLAALLIKFMDILHESSTELAINKLTDFIYELCVKVQENYKKYRIVGDKDMNTRILLCEAVRRVLERAFYFVGIVPLEKI